MQRSIVVGLLMLLSAAAPDSVHARQQPLANDSTEVAQVTFVGARAYPRDVLAAAIVTAQTRCTAIAPLCWLNVGVDRQFLDPLALGADVVRLRLFYYQRGYREAQVSVDTARAGRRIRVTFQIDEGPAVRVASIAFDSAGGVPSAVTRNLPLQVDEPFSQITYEATRDTIRSRLSNQGYALADVLAGYNIPRDSPHVAHVRYELIPGEKARFGIIEVAGAEKVSPAVVRRMLTFHPGDVYTRDAVLRSQRNLFAQELFQHAEIRAAPSVATDTLIDVRVQVNEGDLHRVRVGFGLSTAEFLNAEGRWISRSFQGGARRLELRGRIANLLAPQLSATPLFEESTDIYGRIAGSIAADFSQPWFFGPLNTFSSGLYFERRSFPGVFVRTAGGGYLSFARTLGPGESVSVGYRPELTKLETADGDLIFCIGFVACGPREIEALSELRWLSPLVASYVRDRSNSIFAPTRGYVIRLDAEYGSSLTNSDFSYTRLFADVTDYHSVRPGFVLAWRLRSGWAHALGAADSAIGVHPQKRFFTGGPNSVRGYSQFRLGPKLLTIDAINRLARVGEGGAGCTPQQINDGTCDAAPLAAAMPGLFEVRPLGGTLLLEGNVEMRFPVFGDNIRGAAFVDFGQVWQEQEQVEKEALAVTPGFGLRYFSAVGPIRVDIGYNPQGAERVNVVTTEVEYRTPEGFCQEIIPEGVADPQQLCRTNRLRPLGTVSWNPRESFFDRLQLHFSIGQAF